LGDNSDIGAGDKTPPYQINSDGKNPSSGESNFDSFTEVQDSLSDYQNYKSFPSAPSCRRILSNLDIYLFTHLDMSISDGNINSDGDNSSSGSNRNDEFTPKGVVNNHRYSGVDDDGQPLPPILGFGGRPLMDES
jgi:hypothetical protein